MASRAQVETTDTTSTTGRDTRQQQLAQDEDDVELLLHGRADGEHLIGDDEGLVHQVGIFNLSYLPKGRKCVQVEVIPRLVQNPTGHGQGL